MIRFVLRLAFACIALAIALPSCQTLDGQSRRAVLDAEKHQATKITSVGPMLSIEPAVLITVKIVKKRGNRRSFEIDIVFIKSIGPTDPLQEIHLQRGDEVQFLPCDAGADLAAVFTNLSQSPNCFQSANAKAMMVALRDDGWRLHCPDYRGSGFRMGAGRFGRWLGED